MRAAGAWYASPCLEEDRSPVQPVAHHEGGVAQRINNAKKRHSNKHYLFFVISSSNTRPRGRYCRRVGRAASGRIRRGGPRPLISNTIQCG